MSTEKRCWIYRRVNEGPWEHFGPFNTFESAAVEREYRAGQDPKEVEVLTCDVPMGEDPPSIPYGK